MSLLWFPAHAASLEIVGPCSDKPVYSLEQSIPAGTSAGRFTISLLDANKIPYHGSEAGLGSILNTPEGDAALEVINDREMRAYGWCYEVDGKQPDVMPDKILLQGPEHVRWFYAFSYYKDGQWLTYCEPAYKIKPPKLCP